MSSAADARLLLARGQVREALAAAEAVLRSRPDDLPALLVKGTALLEAREGEQALAALSHAAALHPGSAQARNEHARALYLLGQVEAALAGAQAAKELLSLPGNAAHAASVYLTLVWCYRELRRFKEALETAEEGLARCPDAVLAEYASEVEQDLAEAEKERC